MGLMFFLKHVRSFYLIYCIVLIICRPTVVLTLILAYCMPLGVGETGAHANSTQKGPIGPGDRTSDFLAVKHKC